MADDRAMPPGSLALTRFTDPTAFYDAAGPFLLAHEAEHCLALGICAGLLARPEEKDTYLAVVKEGGEIVSIAVRTPPWHLLLSRTSVPGAAAAVIARDVRRDQPDLPGVLSRSEVSRAFAQEWQRQTGRGYRLGIAQRIYQLDRVIPVAGVPGRLRRATEEDRDLALDWARAFWAEAAPHRSPDAAERTVEARLTSPVGGIYLWEDGGPVSLVGYAGPTPRGIRVGPVYTPPEYRRQGYASAAVAALSQLLLESGRRFVFLFTDLANPTSNRIYQAIGYRPVVDVDDYRFATA